MPTLISEYRRCYYVDVDENETDIDVLMRTDATEFKGPKDPRLDLVVNYLRKVMASGGAVRSQIADLDLPETVAVKPKATFRRA